MKSITICVGSVYGGALETAKAVQAALREDGHEVALHDTPTLDSVTATSGALLICTSTTGTGDLPDNIQPLYVGLTSEFPNIVGRPFGIITLGDSSYQDSFCGAGSLMHDALTDLAAVPVGTPLQIDALETLEPAAEAVPWARHWAAQLP